jgi:D-inositol-3-phosphate glycosyltransferase
VSFSLQYPALLFPGSTQKAVGDKAPPGLKVTTLINSINPFSWFKTAKYIRSQKPDMVIFRYWLPFMAPCLGTVARLVKRGKSGIKVVAVADNILPHEKRFGDNMFTNYFVKGCDSFVVMSKSVLEDLRKFTTTKPAVLQPHPVYNIFGESVSRKEAREKLHLNPNDHYLLFFGFIRKYKGLYLLLNALANEKVKALNVQLLVAGEFYDDKTAYLHQVKSLGIEKNVLFHDHYISKEAVKYYFCASDLVTQPYRDATQSGVTQIAYHFGIPMLVTNVGGLGEIVPNGVAGYVTNVNADEIADAIVDFFANNRSTAMTAGVKENAKNFTWDKFVQIFSEL